MNQSKNTTTLPSEPRRRTPHQLFILTLLLTLGVFLSVIGDTRAQQVVVNGDFNANAAQFTVFPGYATGANPNPGVIPNWTNWVGAMTSKGLNDGLTYTAVGTPFGPTVPGTDTYLFMQNAGNDLGQYLTLSPSTTYALIYSAASRAANTGTFQVLILSDDTGTPAYTYYDSGAVLGNPAAFHTYTTTFTTAATITGTENIQLINVSPGGDNTTDFKGISIYAIPTVGVTPTSTTICSGSTVALVGTYGSSATGAYWSTSGSGTFAPDTNTMSVTYTPSGADVTAGTVTLTLTSTGQSAPATAATATAVVKIDSQPAISAGPNSQVVAAPNPVTFSVTATGGDLTYQWKVSTDNGSTFNATGASDTNASYTIATTTYAMSNNQYQVTISGACGSPITSTNAVLNVQLPPTASAGGNQTICYGATAPLGGVVGGMATGGIWTSSGSGAFSPSATALNAIYYLSAADQAAGTVTLTLTTTGQIAPTPAATATVVVTVDKQPVITGGPSSTTVCQSTPATFSVTATGGDLSYQWLVSIDGGLSFQPVASGPSASYTIASATMGQSNTLYKVVVTGPCGIPVASTNALLTVKLAPTVNAGGNQTICAGNTVSLTGSFGGSATNAYWSTSGSGSFAPGTNQMTVTYTPSLADQTAGSVTLTLTSKGQPTPCGAATSSAVVTIQGPGPAVVSGPTSVTVCDGSPATFSVVNQGTGSLTYQWKVSTDNGLTFNPTSASDTNASYTIDPATIALNSNLYQVVVSGPCGSPITSTNALLKVPSIPATVNAGANQTICAGATVSLVGT